MDGLEAGAAFGEDYRVVRTLYTGGLSTIYEAEHTSTGERRALKVVHGDLGKDAAIRSAFLEEAKRASRIQSQHVAQVLAWGCDPETGQPFVAMELLEGLRLAERMADGPPMTPHELLGFMSQLCDAVAAAHALGVVHRDLKPEGIVLASSPTAGLPYRVEVQFVGVGKIASEIRQNTTAAMSRGLWMAPEQVETAKTPSPATDVWTLGLLSFWLLTGKHYWKTARDMGSAMVTLMREVLFEPLVPATKRAAELGVEQPLPPGFDGWFAGCVARDPARRFRWAADALQALMQVGQSWGPPTQAVAPTPAAASAVAPAVAAQPKQATSATLAAAPAPPPAPPALTIAAAPIAAAPVAPSPPPKPGVAFTIPSLREASQRQQPATPLAAEPPSEAPSPNPPTPAQIPAGPAREGAQLTASAAPPAVEARAARAASAAQVRWAARLRQLGSKVRGRWAVGLAGATLVLALGGYYGTRAYNAWDRKEKRELAAREDKLRELERDTKREREKLLKKLHDEWSDLDSPVPISFADPMWGARDAPLTIVAFMDLRSKACKDQYADLIMLKEHVGAEKLRLVWKHFPLPLKNYSKYLTAKDDKASAKKVDADVVLGKSLGVSRLPAIFVNGAPLQGRQPISRVRELVDAQLLKAQAEIDKGTPPYQLYTTLSKVEFAQMPAKQAKGVDLTGTFNVPILTSPTLGGGADPKVTAVLFGDLTSADTATLYKTLMSVRAKYGDNLRVVWKDKPSATHARARPAAQLAREAKATLGPEAFFSAVSLMLENQTALEDKDLRKYAKKLGLDPTLAMDSVSSSLHLVWVELDESLADLLGVQSTPTMFVNGARVVGLKTASELESLFDAAVRSADQLVAKGFPASTIYEGLVAQGRNDILDSKKSYKEPSLTSPRIGIGYPLVPVQLFCDLTVPECKQALALVTQLQKDNSNLVSVFYRHFPQAENEHSRLLATAGTEVNGAYGAPTFYKFAELWFAKASEKPADIKVTLREVARDAVDFVAAGSFAASTFDASLTNPTYDYQLRRDLEEAEELGFTEVPSFIVGKYSFTGLPTSAQLQALVRKTATE
ncbi:MAG: thioredoxin domain-containing protein [Polyangiaceae bacterium]|nr:thioredoxin domain-containing protein [Polyangiaceae bacterium]